MLTRVGATLVLLGMLSVAHSQSAQACAPVPPAGASVQIDDEEAVIVWDHATHTETFIRRANFTTAARDFGFLLVEWLQPYVAAHWKISAFKIARPQEGGVVRVATGTVRMTFQTDKPLFPYREPEEQRTGRAAPAAAVPHQRYPYGGQDRQ